MKHSASMLRALVPTLILVIVALAWYQFWYQPSRAKTQMLTEVQAEASSRIQRYCHHLETAHEVTNEFQSLNQKWDYFQQSLANPARAEQVQQRLGNVAESHRLTLIDFGLDLKPLLEQINDPQFGSTISSVGVTLEGRGQYDDIGEFLSALSAEPTISAVHSTALQYERPAYPEIYFTIHLDVLMAGNEGEALP